MGFLEPLIMRIAVFLLVASGTLFNCWAIGFLLIEKRRDARRKKVVDEALEEINYHLHRARRARSE